MNSIIVYHLFFKGNLLPSLIHFSSIPIYYSIYYTYIYILFIYTRYVSTIIFSLTWVFLKIGDPKVTMGFRSDGRPWRLDDLGYPHDQMETSTSVLFLPDVHISFSKSQMARKLLQTYQFITINYSLIDYFLGLTTKKTLQTSPNRSLHVA